MNVFITGGSRGIGRATVLKFAEKGWGCAFTYIKNRAAAEETVSLANKVNSELKIKSFQLDIKDPKQVEKVVETALSNFENIHALVNNAAVVRNNAAVMMSNEEWTEVELNTLGANGITVITSRVNVMDIRHALTTNTASAEVVEDSVVQIENTVKRVVRNTLRDLYIGQGIVVDDNALFNIGASTRSILERLKQESIIYGYGKASNPLTGEAPITVKQSSIEPREILVTFTYKPLYPLVWIKVTAATYV